MSNINRAILIGNVARDPEIRSTQNGTRVANFSLATNESWTDKASGERRERAEFHRIVVFNEHLVGVVEKYVRKGSKLYLEGQIQTRKWQDKSGVEKFATEIVLQRYRGEIVLLDKPSKDDARPQKTDHQVPLDDFADDDPPW